MTDPLEHVLSRDHWRAALILGSLGIAALIYIGVVDVSGCGVQKGFTISAVSERVAVTIEDRDGVSVRLSPGLQIPRLGVHLTQSSSLHLPDQAELDIARRGAGSAFLQLKGPDRGASATVTSSDGHTFSLAAGDTLELSSSAGLEPGFILPFQGAVSLGPEVRESVEYLLLSGTVTAFEKPPFANRRAVLTASLAEGDEVRWRGISPQAHAEWLPQQASGFIEVGEDRAVTVVAHAVAPRLVVWRYGAERYVIAPSLFATIARDPVVGLLVPVVAAFGGVLVVYEGVIKLWGAWKGRKK